METQDDVWKVRRAARRVSEANLIFSLPFFREHKKQIFGNFLVVFVVIGNKEGKLLVKIFWLWTIPKKNLRILKINSFTNKKVKNILKNSRFSRFLLLPHIF
jgi:SNF family Na+-dependent transporter